MSEILEGLLENTWIKKFSTYFTKDLLEWSNPGAKGSTGRTKMLTSKGKRFFAKSLAILLSCLKDLLKDGKRYEKYNY